MEQVASDGSVDCNVAFLQYEEKHYATDWMPETDTTATANEVPLGRNLRIKLLCFSLAPFSQELYGWQKYALQSRLLTSSDKPLNSVPLSALCRIRYSVDNGSQYRTKWMNRACAKMGIRLLFAKPYSPEATGNVK